MADDPAALETALARLGRLHPKAIDLSLDRLAARLAALGNPERRLPPVFHVAGTNGKGSTIAFLRAFLEAAGYRCHAFTSPHLVRINESIRLAGTLISDSALLSLIGEVEAVAPDQPITSFEALTAIAFLAFSRSAADATLVEVGLGGRFDATNLIADPHVTAVTRISRDHRQFLGDALTDVAAAKAGIFKPGRPAIIADQPSAEVRARLIAEAGAVGAPLFPHGQAWQVTATGEGFRYRGPARTLDLPPPALVGPHQMMNAGTALAMIDLGGGFTVDDGAVRRGLETVVWPGRLQRLTSGPLAALLPSGWELWLDGAHNDSGGEALAAQAALWRDAAAGGLPLDIVFGARADKTAADILTPLAPYAERLRAVAIPGDPAAMPADAAARAGRSVGIADARPVGSVVAAIQSLVDSREPRRILICGSLYLAGRVLGENG